MTYIDGFLLPVPTRNLPAYRRLARKAGKIWQEHGAIAYKECAGDDIDQKGFASFSQSAQAKRGETVVFSFIVYKSRAHRDQVNKKVMEDPRIKAMADPKNMPFDVTRMAYGGFKVFVEV